MAHPIDIVPSQQAVNLAVVGPGFDVEQRWFRLFLEDLLQ